jgi:ribose-phosphate pyrophosphokinase
MKNAIVFGTPTSQKFVESLCAYSHLSPGNIYHHQFPSGEWYCQLKENVRGADVFLVQPTVNPCNDNLMQLLVMADAARRASAANITAVVPYFGYSRQDRKDKPRVSISAKLVMNLLEAAGVQRVVTMDLHAAQIQGFTDLPVDHLYFRPVLLNALKDEVFDTVVSPDIGAIKNAEALARYLGKDLAIIAKRRKNDTEVEVTQFIGDVKGKCVLIVDDLTESAGTLIQAAKTCRAQGASRVLIAVTHNCLTEVGRLRVEEANNEKVFDSFLCSTSTGYSPFIYNILKYVDVAPIFGDAILKIHNNESISELFQ